jgi:hypothetical protein
MARDFARPALARDSAIIGNSRSRSSPFTEKGREKTGLVPCLLLWVKSGSKRHLKDFLFHCRKKGIRTWEVQTVGGLTCYECTVNPENLDALDSIQERDCVASAEFTSISHVQRSGAGTGPEKVKSSGKAPKVKTSYASPTERDTMKADYDSHARVITEIDAALPEKAAPYLIPTEERVHENPPSVKSAAVDDEFFILSIQ